jgi:hypothetical protein
VNRISRWLAPRFVLGAALSIAAVSAAFFLVSVFSAEGEHTAPTGSAPTESKSLPLTVDFPSGLTPAHAVPLTLEIENTASAAAANLTGPKIEIKVPGDPICATWLEAYGENGEGHEAKGLMMRFSGASTSLLEPIPAGAKGDVLKYANQAEHFRAFLRFNPKMAEEIDQNQCTEQAVTVKATLVEAPAE